MATYVISDIHGEYDLFIKLLKKINFTKYDQMYVLGDFVDKGKRSIDLLKLFFKAPNIKPILGNHEQYFLSYYDSLMWNFTGDEAAILKKLQEYFPEDTETLTWEYVDFLESLPMFVETSEFIGVHAGVQLDENGKVLPMNEQEKAYFIYDRRFADPMIVPVKSKTVLFGHTPCHYDNGTGKFIKTLGISEDRTGEKLSDYAKIRLDTGVGFTRMLGCLRLEDVWEFYVQE